MTQPPDGSPNGSAAAGGRPPGGAPAAQKRHGLLVTAVVPAVLLLCGGGGLSAYLLPREVDGQGTADPKAAVDGFLRAVHTDRDARTALRRTGWWVREVEQR